MLISSLNPIQFWVLNSAFDFDFDAGIATQVIDLCDHPETFNTEDKDKTVYNVIRYYHKVHQDDELFIDIVVDTPANDYKLLLRNADGTHWRVEDFIQVGATNHFTVTITAAMLAEKVGQRVFFAVWETDGADVILVHALTDMFDIVASISRSVVINCQNINEYADAHKDSAFAIRVLAAFVRKTSPEEVKTTTLSTGNPVTLTSMVKRQRLLKVLPSPWYIHEKIKLALKCTTLTIENKSYRQEDAADVRYIDDDNEFGWLLVSLTELNATNRNVYATP